MGVVGPNQERYLLAEINAPVSYFISVWYRFDGKIDLTRFQYSLQTVLNRHSLLRTGFVRDAKLGFRTVLHDYVKAPFHIIEVDEISANSINLAVSPYISRLQDISSPQSFQYYFIITDAGGRQAMLFCHHHAVSDGASLDIFIEEVANHYSGHPPLDEAAVELREDVPVWKESDAEFFQQALSSASADQFHRDRRGTTEICARSLIIDGDLSKALRRAAAKSSLFSVLSAAFAMQIHAQFRSDTSVFTFQSSGRGKSKIQTIGSFSNALPVAVEIRPDESFEALCGRMRTHLRAAVHHETIPYHRILSMTGLRPDFALNLYPDAVTPEFEGLSLGSRQFLPSPSEYGINLRWQRYQDANAGSLCGEAYFDAGKVDPKRVEKFLVRHRALLEEALTRPQSTVAEILAARRPQSLTSLEQTWVQPIRRIGEVVEEIATGFGDRPAVVFGREQLTYGELQVAVEARAAFLHSNGVKPAHRIALLEDRGPNLVIAMLAISRIGASFAVFDPSYPATRLSEQLTAFNPDFLASSYDQTHEFLSVLDAADVTLLLIDKVATPSSCEAPRPPRAGKSDIAYGLFTSGTTGKPKLVQVGHAALPTFLSWQAEAFAIGPADRVTMLSGLGHDPVMRDIFLPLSVGAPLLIPPRSTMSDPRALVEWLRSERPSVVHTTPPLGRLLAAVTDGNPTFEGLRWIFWGGDSLGCDLVEVFSSANPSLKQCNFYGSTETPQAVAFHILGSDDKNRDTPPIGVGTAANRVSVVDGDGRPLGYNDVGEILVETPYHVLLDHSVSDARSEVTGQRHLTGDYGYLLPNNEIMFVGRKDDQVKIRGFRVELADVTKHLKSLSPVNDAVLMTSSDPAGEHQLIAHVSLGGGDHSGAGARIRQELARILPAYMVPSIVVPHATLPLLPNGKIDRGALRSSIPAATSGSGSTPVGVAAFDDREARIADIYADVLGRPIASPHQTFMDLGADSLNSIQAMLRLEAVLSGLPEDWQQMTIADLAARLPDEGLSKKFGFRKLFGLVRLEPAVPLRALAIALIVAFHFKLISIGGGFTFILFFLAGAAFGRFQLTSILTTGSTHALSKGLRKFALIAFPVGLIFGAQRMMLGEDGGLRMMFYAANFIDFASLPPSQLHGVWLWFIGCYVQIMLFIMGALKFPAIKKFLSTSTFTALTTIFLLAASSRFLFPAVFRDGGLAGIPAMSIWAYLPNVHFATFLAGALLEVTRGDRVRRVAAFVMVLAYAMLTSLIFVGNNMAFIVTSVAILTFVSRISLPRFLALACLLISQASLYIYLFHEPFSSIVRRLGIDQPAISFLVAIPLLTIAGVVLDRIYDGVSRLRPGVAKVGFTTSAALSNRFPHD